MECVGFLAIGPDPTPAELAIARAGDSCRWLHTHPLIRCAGVGRRGTWPAVVVGAAHAALWLPVLVPSILMNPLAVGVWERVSALDVLQFPWRLLAPATLGLAVLAGAGLPRGLSPWLLGAVIGGLGLWVLTWTFVPTGDLPL